MGDRNPADGNYWKLFVPNSQEQEVMHSVFTHMEKTTPMNYNNQNIGYILFARAVIVHGMDHYQEILKSREQGRRFETNYRVFITFK